VDWSGFYGNLKLELNWFQRCRRRDRFEPNYIWLQ
jgi:hypothetical protein